MWLAMQSDLPSAPVDLMQAHLAANRTGVPRCKWMPPPWKLNIVNQQWQLFKTDSGVTTYLYSAYYDDRVKYDAISVRILLMSDV